MSSLISYHNRLKGDGDGEDATWYTLTAKVVKLIGKLFPPHCRVFWTCNCNHCYYFLQLIKLLYISVCCRARTTRHSQGYGGATSTSWDQCVR